MSSSSFTLPKQDPNDPLLGSYLGPYLVTRLIGSGGMGRVYEGRQTAPIKKKVALKVMRRDQRSDLMRRRFELELQTLAALNHPNIATIYLSGSRDDGENWFAMEFVEGATLIEYCEQHRLNAAARLKLFTKICDAVHFAHRRGIIHRDLKPANILVRDVDGEPDPKIIDFGIAKITASEKPSLNQATMVTEVTAPGLTVGTLGYMSPEQTQLGKDDVDVRSDIYSLGVVLYELLVGKRPLDENRIQSGTWDQAFALVREYEPERPSKAIRLEAAKDTTTLIDVSSVGGLSKYYRGDLDWIVLKAMEKDRERRYQGADEFGKDILNFLNREPIIAGPPTLRYQTVRFAQRNKALVAGLALISIGMVAGFYGLVYGYIRAKDRETRALQEATSARTTSLLLQNIIGINGGYKGRRSRIVDNLENITSTMMINKLTEVQRVNFQKSIGDAYIVLGDYNKASSNLEESLKISLNILDSKNITTLDITFSYLKSLRLQGRHNKIEEGLKNLIKDYQSVTSESDERIMLALSELIAIQNTLGKKAEATNTLNSIKNFNWDLLKNRTFHRINFLGNYGSFLTSQKKYPEAIENLKAAIALSENKYSKLNHSALISASKLTEVYAHTKQKQKATSNFNHTISSIKRSHGSDHPRYYREQLKWIYFLVELEMFEEALTFGNIALSKIEDTSIGKTKAFLIARTNFASALFNLDFTEESLNELHDIFVKKYELLGPQNQSTAFGCYLLADGFRKTENSKNALYYSEVGISLLRQSKTLNLNLLKALTRISIENAELNQDWEISMLRRCELLDLQLEESRQEQSKIKKNRNRIQKIGKLIKRQN